VPRFDSPARIHCGMRRE